MNKYGIILLVTILCLLLLSACGKSQSSNVPPEESYDIIASPKEASEKSSGPTTQKDEDDNGPRSPAEDPDLKDSDVASDKPTAISNSVEGLGPAMKSTVIDKDKYNQIENGMSYGDVVSIIGSEGELISSSDEDGKKHEEFRWKTEKSQDVDISFENGVVITKNGL